MYKIYINERPLYLLNSRKSAEEINEKGEVLVAHYPGKSKFLLNYIDLMEKSDRYSAIVLYSDHYGQLVKDYEHLYKLIEAAGGLVLNPLGEALLIFRRDHWDLPKGKIDEGEGKVEAAVREVQEETGIKNISVGPKIHETYHTYRNGSGKRILKRTFWYLMKTTDTTVIPQVEEDIEEIIWIKIEDFLKKNVKVYPNILEVLHLGHAIQDP